MNEALFVALCGAAIVLVFVLHILTGLYWRNR